MPALWNGVISFGLVSIPVSLRSATRSHDLSMHQYHAADQGRIRYQKVCELDDEPVPAEDIVKGVETEDGNLVLLDDEDLEDLPVSSSKTIEVLGFVPGEQIDPIHYERSYYAEPGKAGAKPYVLLREALLDSDRIAVVKVTLRRRESLAALRAHDDVLMVHTMLWPDEIRQPEVSGVGGEAHEQELQMALTLIDTMAMDFHPENYSDAYQEALEETIEAKKEGRAVAKSTREQPKAKVISLIDALERSVAAKQSSGERPPAKKTAKKTAKKASARKQTAKKTSARKQTAKKATESKKQAAKATTRKRKSA